VNSPDRPVNVYLPASYASSPGKRYPVVYLLHGFGGTESEWTRVGPPIKPAMDTLVRAGVVKEMIIVMPNGKNALDGSFYTNSTTTGNWDDFISKELVSYIDKKYRTLARAGESRAGRSFHGRVRHVSPSACGTRATHTVALYALSVCCSRGLAERPTVRRRGTRLPAFRAWPTWRRISFLPKVMLALSAAFAPDPKAPPLFADTAIRPSGRPWEPVDAVLREMGGARAIRHDSGPCRTAQALARFHVRRGT